MNTDTVEKIASAVLYEGYLLYPYRQSAVKNQQRFNFGVLYPKEYSESQGGTEAWEMQTECLVSGSAMATVEARIRFLQLAACQQRQEGLEQQIRVPEYTLGSIAEQPLRQAFWCAGAEDAEGRASQTLDGELELGATAISEDVFRVRLTIRNRARIENVKAMSRDDLLLRSLVSVHSILRASGGEFVSLLDPPEELRAAAAECLNVGTWPVLAGEVGQRDTILSSPIILYDYPQIAPESAGDLFDGTEIDEILALRILTMTESEKQELRNGDDRARKILERTEMLPPEHFQKLHGALRGLRPHSEGQ